MEDWQRTLEMADVIFYGLLIALALGEIILRYVLRVARNNIILEYVDSGFIAILLALVIRTVAVQSFKIPSESMVRTLRIGDQLLVNRLAYGVQNPFKDEYLVRYSAPNRGEIIVFRHPNPPHTVLIKRCLGLPGDRIEMRDKALYINGQPLDEPYALHGDPRFFPRESGIARDNFGPLTIPPDQYFMLGDNRDNSADSRFWGLLPFAMIEGRAFFIYWPPSRWRVIR